jgi:putative ABC transport system permease protein
MKKWISILQSVWMGLTTHKLRSILTMLGIVIGVASVITLMSIGKGATASILESIESIGSDLITISPGSFTFGGIRGGSSQTLSYEDAVAISDQVEYIDAVAPYSSTYTQMIYNGENMNAQVIGATPSYKDVQNLEIASGMFFSENEYESGAKVAVVGSDVVETLFGDSDPLGENIRLGNVIVKVIGVLESKGGGFSSADSAIIMPLTALQQTLSQTRTTRGEHLISSIYLTVTDEDKSDQVIEDITALLRDRHRLTIGTDNDFNITSMQDIAQTMEETSQTLTLLLGAIAAIALLVGGIGVMNIMLVSVLERTREIGIRKALGARERDIWVQFLIEAASLTFAGGILGVVIGWVASFIIDHTGFMNTLVSADIVILAVSVSIGIGLFFGFYPAWNASRLNPIEALRSE